MEPNPRMSERMHEAERPTRGSRYTQTHGHETVTRQDGSQLRSSFRRSTLYEDAVTDFMNMLMDLSGALVKTFIAFFALYHIGHLEENAALATAALLGGTDFFARRGGSKFVRDCKYRVFKRFASGASFEEELDEHEEGKR